MSRTLPVLFAVIVSLAIVSSYTVDPYLYNEVGQTIVVNSSSCKTLARFHFSPDSSYELKGSFDLEGGTVSMPNGCVVSCKDAILYNGSFIINSRCRLLDGNFNNIQVFIKNAEKVCISNCSFTGSFGVQNLKADNYLASAIYSSKVKDVEFNHISITNYQWGIVIYDSERIVAENIVFTGVLDKSVDYSINIDNANYHDALMLSNTHFSRAINISAYNCGTCVVLGRTSKTNVIDGCRGSVLWDNGIYISSGNNNIIQNCIFNNVRGTGVKARGSCNIIANNVVSNVGTGYAITGNGTSIGIDEYGKEYNGYGSMITGNVVMNAHNSGISIGAQDGLTPYRFSVTNNSIINCSAETASISIICNGASIVGNNVVCPNSFGIVIAQMQDKGSGGYMITENNISCKRRGIVVQKCKDAVIANNAINTEIQGIVVYQTEQSSFITNKFSGKGKYSVSGHIKGTSNFYKTLGSDDALVPSSFVIIEK